MLWEIRRSGYERKLIGGIVLTGGGALMQHLVKLVEFHTGMTCRIGIPVEHLGHGYRESIASPIFSTAIGLMLKGLQDVEAGKITLPAAEPELQKVVETAPKEPANAGEEKPQSWLENIFVKTKEWFEAEPDYDLNRK